MADGGPKLTPRERDVLAGIVEGMRDAEIASMLGVQPTTVRKLVARMFDKTGVNSRASLVTVAFRRRLLPDLMDAA